jgi:hypothetical protein
MNEGQSARLEGFRALLGTDGVCLTVLSGPAAAGKLNCLLQINPAFEVPSDLIEDPRERACAEAIADGQLPALVKGDRLADARGNKWQVWNREDNPADSFVKFWLTKIVAGVDQ